MPVIWSTISPFLSKQMFIKIWKTIVLVFSSCLNRKPQSGMLEQQKCLYYLTPGGWKSKVIKVQVASEGSSWLAAEHRLVVALHGLPPGVCSWRSFLFLCGHQSYWIRAPFLWPHWILITGITHYIVLHFIVILKHCVFYKLKISPAISKKVVIHWRWLAYF